MHGAAQWQESTSRAEKGRVPVWHTWGHVPRPVIPASVMLRADAGHSRNEGKGVPYRYGARVVPVRLGQAVRARDP